jgi:TIR domain
MPVKIFFCYAHEDEALLNKLKSHLRPLQREGLVDFWHDRDISAGKEWELEINERLNTAQIILLLVSSDFINSDYCYGIEMKRAMERHERGEARVIPIVLRPVDWRSVLGKLYALPTDAKPVSNWRPQDKAFLDIAENIRKIVHEISQEKNSSKEKPETKPHGSVEITDQNNAQVYQFIISEWEKYTDLDNWEEWSIGILTHRPVLEIKRDEELICLSGWLFGRIWPKQYPELDEAFKNFNHVLQDFYHTFHEHTEIKYEEVRTIMFYKLQWNNPTYDEDHKLYEYHVGLVQDLMLELTRAANYICDAIRQFIDPTYRMLKGKVVVRQVFVAYENDGKFELFDYIISSPEYQDQERTLHPYPGLEQFKIDRESRDICLGVTDE